MTHTDLTRERLIETYRKKAKHYDVVARISPVPGYPEHALRRHAVHALDLHRGDTVVDIACGTGLNFPLIEAMIGPDGRIIGVDLTDAMLEQARARIDARGWRNVTLVHADAADVELPTDVDAILSTYALTQVPECAQVIAHSAAALSPGGRCVVLDVKFPDAAPGWLVRFVVAMVRPFASIDQWIERRPWDAIRQAMQEEFADSSWDDLCFGTAFLATGSRGEKSRDRLAV